MPIPQIYYLDSATLGGATSVFLDQQLTNCAPDGYYSDGTITRQQISCVLLPLQRCLSCATPCSPTDVSLVGSGGIYTFNTDTGVGTGAMIVKIKTYAGIGIKATHNSLVYNKLSSHLDGLHQSTVPTNYTFVGATASSGGISGVTFPALDNFLYNGSGFTNLGVTSSLTAHTGDCSFSASDPQPCIMVIPKIVSGSSILNISLALPFNGIDRASAINIACPASLPTFTSSVIHEVPTGICALPIINTYYFVSLNGTAYLSVYDYVFLDANGQNSLPDGYYFIGLNGTVASKYMHVIGGIITSITNC